MTREEISNLIEQKYKEIEELESQKEGLVDYYLKEVGEKMVKHKYYILKSGLSDNQQFQTIKVKSYQIVGSNLIITGYIENMYEYPDLSYLSEIKYDYYGFTPISKEEHDDILDMFQQSYELLEGIQSKIKLIKTNNEKSISNSNNTDNQ